MTCPVRWEWRNPHCEFLAQNLWWEEGNFRKFLRFSMEGEESVGVVPARKMERQMEGIEWFVGACCYSSVACHGKFKEELCLLRYPRLHRLRQMHKHTIAIMQMHISKICTQQSN